MTLNLPLIIFSIAAGAGAGVFYFGGLWWTVRRLAESEHPGLLTLGSFLIRIGGTVALLYMISEGRWPRVLAALFGLLLVRRYMVRRLGPCSAPLSSKGAGP
jgi:F1F0 ATPase subunit 2